LKQGPGKRWQGRAIAHATVSTQYSKAQGRAIERLTPSDNLLARPVKTT